MALVLKDRVRETTSSTGTGTITLSGAVTGYQDFSVIGNGNTSYYAILGGTEWEVGIGTYTASGTTLSRDTVLESSNGGSLVNFSAGTKDVICTFAAEKATTLDSAQTLTNKSMSGSSNTFTNLPNSALTNSSITVNGTPVNLGDSLSVGTVTSVSGSGSYGGLSLSGTVTGSGNITLGGTPTGTWPISVSGSAASATSATTATNSSYCYNYTQSFASNWNTDFSNTPAGSTGIRGDTSTGSSTGGAGGSWWFQQNMRHNNNTNLWGVQVAWGWEDNANILRTRNVQNGTFGSWVTYLNTANTGTYFALNNAATGYQKLPSGLIIQWGIATINNSTQNVYATAFPTAVRSIVLTWQAGSPSRGIEVTTRTTTYFIAREGGGGGGSSSGYYVAIGY